MAIDFPERDSDFLSADAIRVYGLIADGERVPDRDADCVAELVAQGFVTVDHAQENRPIALNPKDVAQRRLNAALQEAAHRVAMMAALPALSDELGVHYDRAQWRAGDGSEYIDDVAVVNARLDDVIGQAQFEILAAQPGGPRTQEQLNRSLERDTLALDRGVAKRTLYRATVRDTPVTAEYARAMSMRTEGQQAEFRTLAGPFERAIIVDRRVAFVSNHLVEGAPEHSAWLITDRAMVAYIAAEFEAKWRRADPWHGEVRSRRQVDTVTSVDGVRTTRRQREIMRDVVDGRDQRATAGRLGISVRTVSDEINALKDLFFAESREQLAFKWAFAPDRIIDDGTPEADGTATGDGAAESAA